MNDDKNDDNYDIEEEIVLNQENTHEGDYVTVGRHNEYFRIDRNKQHANAR